MVSVGLLMFFILLAISKYHFEDLGQLSRRLDRTSEELQKRIHENTGDENELKAILSSMVEGVIVIDKNDRIVILTEAMADMLELRSQQAVGKPYWEIIRHDEINTLIRDALMNKTAVRRELSVIFPKETYFSMQISPILSEHRELAGIVAVFHDITEIKSLEKIRSEFVANASHELKTPLTSIKGFVETLQDADLNDKSTTKRFLDIIYTHTKRLENLVNDLLSLSAIESKEAKFHLEPSDVGLVIENIVHLYKSKLESKKHLFTLDLPAAIPQVVMDSRKMEEVFSNLLDNAIKFTPQGGTISIRVYEEAEFLRVDVQDSGIGIPPEHLSRIFERFYRVDRVRSREMGGTGLGLAIVKHILLRHNRKVAVQSEPQKGSTFSVFLPKHVG